MNKYPYSWTLKDAVFTKDKGTVFSCFASGGGSTMGYKLAGFDVIGCNEIDPKMMAAYRENHKPKYSFLEPIQTFKDRDDLPEELYNLTILDGSPPCSSFSMVGSRENDWGKEKKFKEGQSLQVLDTLFFDFIDLAKKLKPKIVVAENVKGLLLGNAKSYVIEIYKQFDEAGYILQHFLLDASKMGVPQRRERVFFIAMRKDLCSQFMHQVDMFTHLPKIELNFNEKPILFKDVMVSGGYKLTPLYQSMFEKRIFGDRDFGDIRRRIDGKTTGFGQGFVYENEVCQTITSKRDCICKFNEPFFLHDEERISCGTFPIDYNFKPSNASYIIGMSVPPVMTAQIADRIYEQWISKINFQMS